MELAFLEENYPGVSMRVILKKEKRNPLSKGQNRLLQESLRRLLGNGLLEETQTKSSETNSIKLRVILDSQVLK